MKRDHHMHGWKAWLLAGLLAVCPRADAYAQTTPDESRSEAKTRFAQGVMLLEQGHADRALAPLEEAWRLSGHEPNIGERLAQAYYATRDVSRADLIAGGYIQVDETPVPVIPIAISGLWDSMFSRKYGPLRNRWPRRIWAKITLRVGAPVLAAHANVDELRQRVVELRGVRP